MAHRKKLLEQKAEEERKLLEEARRAKQYLELSIALARAERQLAQYREAVDSGVYPDTELRRIHLLIEDITTERKKFERSSGSGQP